MVSFSSLKQQLINHIFGLEQQLHIQIGSKKYSYAVGATPEGIVIGARNLLINTINYRKSSPLEFKGLGKDSQKQLLDQQFPVEIGETYIFQACTNGIWGNHSTTGQGNGVTHFYVYLYTDEQVIGEDNFTTAIALDRAHQVNSIQQDVKFEIYSSR